MSLDLTFSCPLPNGLHARPASALEEIARRFRADITLTNRRSGRTANAKSVLALVGAEIRHEDKCCLTVNGPDEQEALAALTVFLREKFPHCDDALPVPAAGQGELPLPPMLRQADGTFHRGTPAVPGAGNGRIVWAGGLRLPDSIALDGAADAEAEARRLEDALAGLLAAYEERLSRRRSRTETDLLKAHRSLARDPEFRACLLEAVRQRSRTAAGAIADAEARFTAMLGASGSELLRERALDVQDVCSELLRQVYGKAVAGGPQLTEPAILAADTLTPGQFLALDRAWLKGLALGQAGATSHTVILARSFGVPSVIGLADLAALRSLEGQEAVVDGDLGVVATSLSGPARRYFALEQRRLEGRRARQARFVSRPAATFDGRRLEIAVNVATADEAALALAGGAEGIGIFRTEMLFLDRDTPPDEEEQFLTYRQALAAAGERSVTFRTLDIGGDKPLPYLNLPAEDNPFLGYRAVRIYPEFEALFRSQIRALVRASAFGRLKIIIPMLTNLEEARWIKRVIAEEQAAFAAQGINFDPHMEVGAMIEVPAAAFLLEELGRELDFFSIGSNDLLQYFAAADRANPRLGRLHDPLQPAFLRLLERIAGQARAAGKWIGLCGEMGGQTVCLPLMVGLGLDEISVVPSALAPLKAELAAWTASACRELTERALACATAEEVRALLKTGAAARPYPLLDPELVLLHLECLTKEEAVKVAVDQLYVLGRTEQPREVEAAIWQREQVYSTGFGHGFAIPHCKTTAVAATSLVVLRLRTPVVWGASDGQPVGVILLLAVRESEQASQHLKVLARLARKLMHEDFRERLAKEPEAGRLCRFILETVS